MFSSETKQALSKFLSEKEIGVLWTANQRAELFDYLFTTKDDLKWFFPAKILGYFEPGALPAPIEDKEHYYSIPEWPMLTYLKKVADKVATLPAEQGAQYKNEIIAIITNVSARRQEELGQDERSLVLDNYRTWYHFARILSQFQNDDIPAAVLRFIPSWLKSRFDVSLAGAEIAKLLLPKFLESSTTSDIEKAEIITSALIGVKWLPLSEGLRKYGDLEKPKLALDEYWLMESIVAKGTARKLGGVCSDEFLFTVGEKIHEVLRREKPSSLRLETAEAQDDLVVRAILTSRTSIKLQVGRMKRADHWLSLDWNTFKPAAETACEGRENWPSAIKQAIASQSSEEMAESARAKIEHFVDGFFDDHSYIWLKSLASANLQSLDSPKEALTILLRELLIGRVTVQRGAARPSLKEFAGARFDFKIFKRLVVFLTGKFWPELRDLFWEMNTTPSNALFQDHYFEAETFETLSANATSLSPEEKTKLKEIIAAGPRKVLEDEHKATRILFWKQRWYGSLKADPEFLALYEQCRELTNQDAKPRHRETMVRWGHGRSPLPSAEILKMSNTELAEYVPTFESRKRESWDDPTAEALAMSFHGAASQSPDKFASDLKTFSNLGYRYVYEVLAGILEAIHKDPACIDWNKFLSALPDYLSRQEFWADSIPFVGAERYGADHKWVVGQIAQIIREASRTKDVISHDLDGTLQSILFLCLDHLAVSRDGEKVKDPVSLSINSSTGKTLEAFLDFSLRIARRNQESGHQPLWNADLKAKSSDALFRGVVEAHEILGRYMDSFYGLDKAWVLEQIDAHQTASEHLWYAFVSGYLHREVFQELIDPMEPHYNRALAGDMEEDRANEELVRHIAIGYLYFGDQTPNAPARLMNLLISGGNSNRLRKLIGFLWMQRADAPTSSSKAVLVEVKGGKPETKIIEQTPADHDEEEPRVPDLDRKVIAIWKQILQEYAGKSKKTDADLNVLIDLQKLMVFLPELSEESVGWLKISVGVNDEGFTSSFTFDYLNRLKDRGAKERNAGFIADLMILMLRSSTPDYKAEHIISLVEFVFVNGNLDAKRKAAEICDTYAQRGRPELLGNVYRKHKPQ